jgi:hypothetical protein
MFEAASIERWKRIRPPACNIASESAAAMAAPADGCSSSSEPAY